MKNAVWRGRIVMFGIACMTLLTAGGCSGLSDRQLSSVLQQTVTTALSTLVQSVLSIGTGN